eukprot:scpid85544/ scgid0633/ Putative threonine dehydratase; Threonine deaminase
MADQQSDIAEAGSTQSTAAHSTNSADSGVGNESSHQRENGGVSAAATAASSPEQAAPSFIPTIEDAYAAREHFSEYGVMRTPLIRLNVDMVRVAQDGMCGGMMEVYLKLENLQPIGSFELRGASYALATTEKEKLQRGIVTASTGNFAQGLAACAKRKGYPISVVVPDYAPIIKHSALERLGASVRRVPFEQWWEVFVHQKFPGLEDQHFIRPSGKREILAGNATLALEILEDLPDVDAIVVPYSSGGLCLSVGSVLQARKPDTRLIACEVNTSTPLNNALLAGRPFYCQHSPSFVDGLGFNTVLPEVWPHVQRMITTTARVSLNDTARAIRLMVERNHVVAEGAGAAPVAAALTGQAGPGKVVCVVSGGNIDATVLADVLQGIVPMPSGRPDARHGGGLGGNNGRQTETSL